MKVMKKKHLAMMVVMEMMMMTRMRKSWKIPWRKFEMLVVNVLSVPNLKLSWICAISELVTGQTRRKHVYRNCLIFLSAKTNV